MYQILFTKISHKELLALGSTDKKRVFEKIKQLNCPFPTNFDIKKLSGIEEFYRLRVGKVRVLFEIDTKSKSIWIRKIGYRGGIY